MIDESSVSSGSAAVPNGDSSTIAHKVDIKNEAIEESQPAEELAVAEETEQQEEPQQDQEPEPEIDIVINNVVSSFAVRCHLNLKEIALNACNVEFRRENGMVTMKLRKPYTTASIWSSGRITCTGATSEEQVSFLFIFFEERSSTLHPFWTP